MNFTLNQTGTGANFALMDWWVQPNQPQNLAVSMTSPRVFSLSWTQGAPDLEGSGFKIYRKTGQGSWELKQTLPLSQTSWNDNDIQPNTIYSYRVYEYLATPYGDVLSSPAEILAGYFERIEYGFFYEGTIRTWKYGGIKLSDSGTGTDSRYLSARLKRLDQATYAESSLLRAFLQGNETGMGVESSKLREAVQIRGEHGEGADNIANIFRGYWEPSASDSGVGEERSLVTAWLKAAERALGAEFTELEAILVTVDSGNGAERPISWLFVRRTGEVWGMTEIQLEAIQK